MSYKSGCSCVAVLNVGTVAFVLSKKTDAQFLKVFLFFFFLIPVRYGVIHFKSICFDTEKKSILFFFLSFPNNNNRKFLKVSVDRFKLGESCLKVNSVRETPTTEHFRSWFERLVL